MGGMESRSGRAVRTVKGAAYQTGGGSLSAHHRTPMAAAERDIFIIAAYLNLCAILYHLPAGIGANHHHRLAPAMADCPDLAQIVSQRQQAAEPAKAGLENQSAAHSTKPVYPDHRPPVPAARPGLR